MTRPLRVEFAHGLYHVTSRGDGREDIFLEEGDRGLFLDVLADTRERFGARQDSCRLIHAARGCLSVVRDVTETAESRSGLSATAPTADQLRVWRDQRAGLRPRASVYSA